MIFILWCKGRVPFKASAKYLWKAGRLSLACQSCTAVLLNASHPCVGPVLWQANNTSPLFWLPSPHLPPHSIYVCFLTLPSLNVASLPRFKNVLFPPSQTCICFWNFLSPFSLCNMLLSLSPASQRPSFVFETSFLPSPSATCFYLFLIPFSNLHLFQKLPFSSPPLQHSFISFLSLSATIICVWNFLSPFSFCNMPLSRSPPSQQPSFCFWNFLSPFSLCNRSYIVPSLSATSICFLSSETSFLPSPSATCLYLFPLPLSNLSNDDLKPCPVCRSYPFVPTPLPHPTTLKYFCSTFYSNISVALHIILNFSVTLGPFFGLAISSNHLLFLSTPPPFSLFYGV